jgi:hypothetical protein
MNAFWKEQVAGVVLTYPILALFAGWRDAALVMGVIYGGLIALTATVYLSGRLIAAASPRSGLAPSGEKLSRAGNDH